MTKAKPETKLKNFIINWIFFYYFLWLKKNVIYNSLFKNNFKFKISLNSTSVPHFPFLFEFWSPHIKNQFFFSLFKFFCPLFYQFMTNVRRQASSTISFNEYKLEEIAHSKRMEKVSCQSKGVKFPILFNLWRLALDLYDWSIFLRYKQEILLC